MHTYTYSTTQLKTIKFTIWYPYLTFVYTNPLFLFLHMNYEFEYSYTFEKLRIGLHVKIIIFSLNLF